MAPAFAAAYACIPVRLICSPAPLAMLMMRPRRVHAGHHRLREPEAGQEIDGHDPVPLVGITASIGLPL
jgi:hypothetical protein